MKRDYIKFITEKTPWFVGDIVLCVTDLSNINMLATGGYGDNNIRLWDLKNAESNENEKMAADNEKQPTKGKKGAAKDAKVDPKEEKIK